MKKILAALMIAVFFGSVCVAADVTIAGKVDSVVAADAAKKVDAKITVADAAGKMVSVNVPATAVITGVDGKVTTLDKVAKGAEVSVVADADVAKTIKVTK